MTSFQSLIGITIAAVFILLIISAVAGLLVYRFLNNRSNKIVQQHPQATESQQSTEHATASQEAQEGEGASANADTPAGSAPDDEIPELHRLFGKYVTEPSKENYMQMFEIVTTADFYSPYSQEINHAMSILSEKNDVAAALKVALTSMPNQILSPKAHLIIGYLLDQAGHKDEATAEAQFSMACLVGILNSGDGSETAPYIVSRVSDEYDVLEQLEKEYQMRSVFEKNEREFDVITCTDGSEIWFDITIPKANVGKTFPFA